ncbi:MAG TPA: preprotein translocase subunit SecG [Gammaproteobacteria bacterium]|nr:preprotein translocase subunit SecG [Gammaproteobacteria bacterium]
MYTALVILQVLVSIALVTLVLLQHGKGADAGAAFGSGASATVFGARGSASFLTRATGVLATIFFLNSLALSTPIVIGRKHAPVSVTQQVPGGTKPEEGTKAPTTKTAPNGEAVPPKPGKSSAPAKSTKPSQPADVPSAPSSGSGGTSGGTGTNSDLPPN